MKRRILSIGAALIAGLTLAGGASAHDWGGGTCIGNGCSSYQTVDDDDDDDAGPRIRHHDRRSYHSDRRYDRDDRFRDHDDDRDRGLDRDDDDED